MLEIEERLEVVQRPGRPAGGRPRRRPGRVRLLHRPLGVRQVHPDQRRRRAAARPTAATVSLDGRAITEPGPRPGHGVPELLAAAPAEPAGQRAGGGQGGPARALEEPRPTRSSSATSRAVGLWEHKDKRPAQVSGGMQQRAAVARAFAVSPRLLLLDEPFGALDALTRARLQQQLVDLWQHESTTETVLMVTHGIDEAILLADRIVVMANPPSPSIIDVIPVDLPRPRDRTSVIDDPAFRMVQERLMALLTAEEPAAA